MEGKRKRKEGKRGGGEEVKRGEGEEGRGRKGRGSQEKLICENP